MNKNLWTCLSLILVFSPITFAQTTSQTVTPEFTIINETPHKLTMLCGTKKEPGYLKHDFFNTNADNKNSFTVVDKLFKNPVDSINCSVYRIEQQAQTNPKNYPLILSFLLIPETVNNEIRIKGYVDTGGSLEYTPVYNFDHVKNTLILRITISKEFKHLPKNVKDLAKFPPIKLQ